MPRAIERTTPERRWAPRIDGALSGTLVQRVLAARGLSDPGAAAQFLDPSLKQLHDPSLMEGMDAAAARLLGALNARERIVIYGDYDVDGITATAILFHMLRAVGRSAGADADVATYVPHRIEEGYGLNSAALVQLARDGARVAVSVDCGVTAVEPARAAAAAGLDLIITDHHTPPTEASQLPTALAVVHPGLPGGTYPFRHLSGAGVAYKLAWRIATLACGGRRVTDDLRAVLMDLLAFAAVGTVADVVPLIGENRVLARFGLGRVKNSPLVGLRALVEACGLSGDDIDAEHVGFAIGPRLNACGRLGHAREAVDLLTIADRGQADDIARRLSRLNDERRRIEQRIVEEAIEAAITSGMAGPDRRIIVLSSASWHRGVVGIACSRLVERFGKPVILLQEDDGVCHGSGRSVEGFALHAALARCAEHLVAFGGHDMAAGLHLRAERVAGLVAALDACAREAPPGVLTLRYDCDASVSDLTGRAVSDLERLAPFGAGNARPRVRMRGVSLVNRPEPLGREGRHARFLVRQNGSMLRLVGWGWGERAMGLSTGSSFDAIVSPKLSTWSGRTTVEAELDDIRPAGYCSDSETPATAPSPPVAATSRASDVLDGSSSSAWA